METNGSKNGKEQRKRLALISRFSLSFLLLCPLLLLLNGMHDGTLLVTEATSFFRSALLSSPCLPCTHDWPFTSISDRQAKLAPAPVHCAALSLLNSLKD